MYSQTDKEESPVLRKFFFLFSYIFMVLSSWTGYAIALDVAIDSLQKLLFAMSSALTLMFLFFVYYVGMSIWEDVQEEMQKKKQKDDFK